MIVFPYRGAIAVSSNILLSFICVLINNVYKRKKYTIICSVGQGSCDIISHSKSLVFLHTSQPPPSPWNHFKRDEIQLNFSNIYQDIPNMPLGLACITTECLPPHSNVQCPYLNHANSILSQYLYKAKQSRT